MKVDIKIFEKFDGIAKRYDVKDVPWAEAAFGNGNLQSHISNYRSQALGGKPKRVFTIGVCHDLFNGLKKLIGGDIVTNEVKSLILKESDPRQRAHLIICIASESDLDTINKILEAIVNKDK